MDLGQFSPTRKTNEDYGEKPLFLITLEALPQIDAVKALRALLKRAWRSHGLRCVDLSTFNNENLPMDINQLENLGRFAASNRGNAGFDVTFLKCDGNNGQWSAGKNRTDMNGRKLVADVQDAMQGHVRFKD